MLLKISEGNSKLGKVANLSMPPIVSCPPGVPCAGDCYAMNAYRIWPAVTNAWDSNYELYKSDPDWFFGELQQYLIKYKPERFRLHVGGDCPDENYFKRMCSLFTNFPNTKVLMFTKRHNFNFYLAPFNFKVVLSIWPGMPLPVGKEDLPWAWLAEDDRAPLEIIHIRCPGKCDGCGYECWNTYMLPIIFDKH